MKRIFTALGAFALALCLSLTLFVSPVCAAEEPQEDLPDSAGYLVILAEPAAAFFANDPIQQATLSAAYDEREELLPVAEDLDIYKAQDLSEIQNLVYSGQVAIVEPDYQVELFDVPAEPNDHHFTDTLYNYQYNLKGTDASGSNGIRVQSAWDVGLTGAGVTVAVIDSGLNLDHLDAPAKVTAGRYYFYREEPNGRYKFTVKGVTRYYNFYSSDWVYDDVGHGTMVGGIIAAKTNNATKDYAGGIAGIAPDVTFMPIKCFTTENHQVVNDQGQVVTEKHLGGYISNMIGGINYAAENGADIINMSWGVSTESNSLKRAIDNAYSSGCILVAAVGNEGPKTVLQYPAAFDNVIGVGSTNKNGALSDFSQRNASVDLCAPGGTRGGNQIYSLSHSSSTGIARGDGTSFSTPAVVGAIALLKEADPDMTQADFLNLLPATCDPVQTSTADDAQCTGYGLLNLKKLLDAIGYGSTDLRRNDNGSYTIRGAVHPKSSAAASDCFVLLGAYNAEGHLLDAVSDQAAYNATYGTYSFNGTLDALPTLASVRAFFLDPAGGRFTPLCVPAASPVTP